MGILKNIIKNIAQDAFNDAINKSLQEGTDADKQEVTASNTASQGVVLSSPKALREVKETLYDEDDNGKEVNIDYSFMLSRDFVDSASNAGEIDYLAVYAPECDDEFCEYDLGMSTFMVVSAPENEIYNMIDKYKHSGTPNGVYSFERVNDMGSKIYFRACTLVRGLVLYFYAIDRGISYTNNYIGVMYEQELHGTPLEQKMMSEVDEAVRSYKENQQLCQR